MDLEEVPPTPEVSQAGQGIGNATFEIKCIRGCKIDTSKAVIGLDCFHFICSDSCVTKLKSACKPGTQMTCTTCSSVIKPEKLKNKIIPVQIFIKKSDYTFTKLICENCIHNRPASAFCPECPSLLCSQCFDLHPQTRATKEHKVKNDISEQKKKYIEKMLDAETKCGKHGKPLLEFCIKCDSKFCQSCASVHQGHATYNIENEKQTLKSRIASQRKLRETLDRAVKEIREKTTEIMTVEWNKIIAQINEHFTALISILAKRRNELENEAKGRVRKQLGALNMRMTCAEMWKASSETFDKAAVDILANHADTAVIKFLRQYEDSVKNLDELEKTIASKYNQYVDKDWHFGLDMSAVTEVQNYLKEYCQVEYSQKPRSSSSSSASTSSNVRVNKESISLRGGSSNVEMIKSPSRRIAVKSTGGIGLVNQLIVNKAQLQPKTYSRMKKTSLQSTSSENPDASHKTIEVEDLDTETEAEDDEDMEQTSRSKKSKSRRGPKSVKNEKIDTPNEKKSSSRSLALTNGSSSNELEQPLNTSGNIICKNPTTESRAKESPRASPDSSKSSVSIGDDTKSEVTEEIPAVKPNVPGQLDQRSSGSGQSRPDGVSPDSSMSMSSVSESSEMGLGKRERKKKEFHDFVDTDKSLKMLRKQNSEIASAARVRQKPTSSKLVQPKATRSSQIQENEGEDVKYSDAGKASSDYEDESDFSDENSSEGPSLRRQSLRKRTANNPETPPESSARKRSRASSQGPVNKIDVDAFQEAPASSFDFRPDPDYDYPVQGQGRMKITNIDENEDYCCICLDGGEEIIVCCDFCPKVFHMTCHLPVIESIPAGEEKWRCNYDITKDTIDEIVASCPNPEGSEKWVLSDSNKRHFLLACKFVMECYKIPEIPTMRWEFPAGYKKEHGKLPFHMKYIRERLCLGTPEPFSGVEEMLLAFRQMFLQAFIFYKKKQQKFRPDAVKCFQKFLELVDMYYPKYRDLFRNVLVE